MLEKIVAADGFIQDKVYRCINLHSRFAGGKQYAAACTVYLTSVAIDAVKYQDTHATLGFAYHKAQALACFAIGIKLIEFGEAFRPTNVWPHVILLAKSLVKGAAYYAAFTAMVHTAESHYYSAIQSTMTASMLYCLGLQERKKGE